MSEIYLLPATNESVHNVFYFGLQNFDELDDPDRIRLYSYLHKFCRTAENLHYQFLHRALDGDIFGGLSKQFIAIMSLPAGG